MHPSVSISFEVAAPPGSLPGYTSVADLAHSSTPFLGPCSVLADKEQPETRAQTCLTPLGLSKGRRSDQIYRDQILEGERNRPQNTLQ